MYIKVQVWSGRRLMTEQVSQVVPGKRMQWASNPPGGIVEGPVALDSWKLETSARYLTKERKGL